MEADKDRDGKISFEEFTKMVENTDVSMSMTLGKSAHVISSGPNVFPLSTIHCPPSLRLTDGFVPLLTTLQISFDPGQHATATYHSRYIWSHFQSKISPVQAMLAFGRFKIEHYQ